MHPSFRKIFAIVSIILAYAASSGFAWTSGATNYTPAELVVEFPAVWSQSGNTFIGSDGSSGTISAGGGIIATNGESLFWSNGLFWVNGTLDMRSATQSEFRGTNTGVGFFDRANSTNILRNVALKGFARYEIGAPGAVYIWSNVHQLSEIRASSDAANGFRGFNRVYGLLNSNIGASTVFFDLSGMRAATNADAFVDLVSSKLIADNNFGFRYGNQGRVFRTDTTNAPLGGPGNFLLGGSGDLSLTNHDVGLFDREYLQVRIRDSNGVAMANVAVSVFADNLQSNRMAGATNVVAGGVYTNGFVDGGMVRLTNATMLTLADGATPQGYAGIMLLDNQAVMPTGNSTFSATGFTYSIFANYLGADYALTNNFNPYHQSGGFLFEFNLPVAIPEPSLLGLAALGMAALVAFRRRYP